MNGEPEIYCPLCKWRPETASRWSCIPSCGAVWNTFWTGGVCPQCGYKWLKTQCLACGEISLHKDWYHFPDKANDVKKERRDVPETVES